MKLASGLLLAAVFLAQNSFAQEQPKTEEVPKKIALGLSITPAAIQRTNASTRNGLYNVKTPFGPGVEVLANIYAGNSGRGNFVFSAGFLSTAFKLQYRIPKESFEPDANRDQDNRDIDNILAEFIPKIQAEYQYRFSDQQVSAWYASAGLSILYTPDGGGLFTLSRNDVANGLIFYEENSSINSRNRPWVDLHISGGREFRLKSSGSILLGAKINYSPSHFSNGTYRIIPNNGPSVTGNFKLKTGFYGISGAYIFGRTRRVLQG
ncbi:MAG: hypothetical protein ABW174_07935 [Flavitalea sp.]